MEKTTVSPRRLPKPRIQGIIPQKYACPKCGGKVQDIPGGFECQQCGRKVVIADTKVGWLKKAFHKSAAFVNGWKTAAGLVMAGIGTFAVSGPAGVWLQVAGYAVSGAGGVHKVIKKKNCIKQDKKGGRVTARDWIDLVIDILAQLKAFVEGGES